MKRLLLAVAAVVSLACGGGGGPPAPTVFTIASSAPVIGFARAAQLMTVGALGTVNWSVLDANCGSISASGAYTAPPCPSGAAAAPGTFSVTCHVQAESNGATAQAALSVADVPVGISITPPSANVAPGGTQQFTANQTWACGGVTH